MPPPDQKQIFVDAAGTPHTEMDLAYPDGTNPGKITLSISSNRPPQERNEALEEYKNLAEVLKFDAKVDKEKGSIAIETGTRSPEGLMMFISSSLEERGLVKPGEAHKNIEAVLRLEDPSFAIPQQEMSAAMMAAMSQVKEAGAALVLASAGTRHTTQQEEHTAPQRVPNVAVEQGAARGRGVV